MTNPPPEPIPDSLPDTTWLADRLARPRQGYGAAAAETTDGAVRERPPQPPPSWRIPTDPPPA